ncbi:hypothetical protein IDM40_12210 [Nocardiopsis sp. HNM0947]|uniref:Uncharacterized protein n=1 Tax=Nocardiopsis coralli TaxID=2772213 RepID=A0ABR9P6K4_9ACTN|nr:hypothetical protein [Nocardiopsis coralli]MBE2999463.1 hypothetical protein [Nocardiopsis coralli]
MVETFRNAFQELIDASVATDPHHFPPTLGRVHTHAAHVPAGERELALEALADLLNTGHLAPGITADLCVLAGALVELGTDPGPTAPTTLHLLHTVGQGALAFTRAWTHTQPDPPPTPEHVTAHTETRITPHLGPDTAPAATLSWWAIERHALAAHTMLGEPTTRAHLRRNPTLHAQLMALTNQLSPHLDLFEDLRALLRMSEATSALVLHRTTGRAFRVLYDGIGDNFQLHTLLADALIGPRGQHLQGQEPDPRWVSAFRDGPTDPAAQTVRGWWNLIAHDGTWVWNEGVPAEIPTVEGERVLVLDPQPYPRSWNARRRHRHVFGWLVVDGELAPAEAQQWWKHIAPAQEALPPSHQQSQDSDLPPLPEPVTAADLHPGPESTDGPTNAAERESEPEPQTQEHPRTDQDPVPEEPEGDEQPQRPPEPTQDPPEPAHEPQSGSDPEPGQGRRRAHPGLGLPPLPPEVSRSTSWAPTWRS